MKIPSLGKNRNFIIAGVAVAVLLTTYFVVSGNRSSDAISIMSEVKKGQFRVEIETTGELEAKNSVKVLGPAGLRNFRMNSVTIQTIVDEGTMVKKGDFVASLDRSEFQTRYEEKLLALEKEQSEFTQIQLDTTLLLREARDQLINLKSVVEEQEITLEQSKFEPPATIKQAEISVKRAKREYDQAIENYKIKKRQNSEKMKEQNTELRKAQGEFNELLKLSEAFRISAPEDGMVIYRKGYDNKPIKAGSQISLWDPTVATLPDLTKMLSKTYVNEVDVRKVHPGQSVEIGLDAYPDKKLSGVVTRVANVGEQLPNSDAKVFQVDVEIKGTDTSLRPAMTTSNKIIAAVVEDALYIPLEGLHSASDSITYVFLKSGVKASKQEVIIGQTNANDVVILGGLNEGDVVYLSIPQGMDQSVVSLLPEMNGKRKKPEPEEIIEPTDLVMPNNPNVGPQQGPRGNGGGGRQRQQNPSRPLR